MTTAANGSESSDLNTSMWICSAGAPAVFSASSAAAMNGPGPQMNASRPVYGAARPASAAALGSPCTDSSQCTTVNRSGYLAASSRSAPAKITEFSSRLA